jgi:hypothetical protein
VKQIRKRLTYANVMSSLAIFLVIGGATAFAALGKNTVGSKQLKKNAVTTPKIKKNAVTAAKIRNGAVTGAKVNVSTLGKVPSAANADNAGNAGHANSADNANNANTVGGLRIVKFSFNGPSPLGKSQILDFNGLQLQAECSGGEVTLTATTTVSDSEISAWASDASGGSTEGLYEDDFGPGVTFTLPMPSGSDVMGDSAFTGGNLQTVRFFYNEEDEVGSNDCLLNGYAIG